MSSFHITILPISSPGVQFPQCFIQIFESACVVAARELRRLVVFDAFRSGFDYGFDKGTVRGFAVIAAPEGSVLPCDSESIPIATATSGHAIRIAPVFGCYFCYHVRRYQAQWSQSGLLAWILIRFHLIASVDSCRESLLR